MRRYQVFVDSRVDQLVGAETVVCPLEAPDPYLWYKIVVDLLDYILVFDYQLERDDVAGGVDAFICSSTSDEGGFLGIVGVGFRDGACCDKGLEEVSFYRFVVMRPVDIRASSNSQHALY